MRTTPTVFLISASVLFFALCTTSTCLADGDEILGPPSISVASGTDILAAGVGLAGVPPGEGTINLDELRKAKIAELAPLLESNTDMAPEHQVVLLQWLIELFDSTSNINGMKRGYDKILSLYPYDVGTLNRYARLYIEKEK